MTAKDHTRQAGRTQGTLKNTGAGTVAGTARSLSDSPLEAEPAAPRGRERRRLKLANYKRVSRQGDRDDERFRSPEFQGELNERKAIADGFELVDYPIELDVSGSKKARAVLDRIIADIEAGAIHGICVARLNRLSRLSPRERIELFDRIESAGGVVVSASESLDVSTPEGRFAREVFLAAARMEWERYAEGFQHAKENAVAAGVAVGKRRAPFGYTFDAKRRLVVDEDTAPIVRDLFHGRAAGASYGDLLETFETRTGRSSSRATIAGMLINRAYLGEVHYGKVERLSNESAHAAIVDEELFAEVQRVTAARRGDRTGKGSGRAKALLAGIATCAGCGAGLLRSSSSTGTIYRCPNDTRHCAARASIAEAALDEHVIGAVLEWAGPLADELVEVELELDAEGERIVAEHKLEQAERVLVEWAGDVDAEERDPIAYKAGRQARRTRVEFRRRELDALGAASELETARSTIRRALAGDELAVDERRRLLGVVLAGVVVRRRRVYGEAVTARVELTFAASDQPLAENAPELVDEPAA